MPGSMPRIILSLFKLGFIIIVATTEIFLHGTKINFLYALLKVSITVLAVFFICKQVFNKNEFEIFLSFVNNALTNTGKCILLLLTILLMIVNWGVEAVKWRFLLKYETKISFAKALHGVLLGVALTFFTPNRVGEFAGRVLILNESNRINGALAAIAASLSQLIITLLAGIVSLAVLFPRLTHFSSEVSFALISGAVLLGLPLIYFYFNIHLISKIRLPFIKKNFLEKYLKVYETYSKKDLVTVAGLSAFRYVIFTLQYVLIFKVADIHLPFSDLIFSTGLIFLVMTILPSIAILEPAMRVSVSAFVMQNMISDISAILTVSFAVWFINLVIPSLAGSVLFVGAKFSRRGTNT